MGWYYWFHSSLTDSSENNTQTSCPALHVKSTDQHIRRSSDWQRQKQPCPVKKKEQPSRLLSYFTSPRCSRSKIVAKQSVKCRKMGSNLKLFSAQERPALHTPHPPAHSPLPQQDKWAWADDRAPGPQITLCWPVQCSPLPACSITHQHAGSSSPLP